MVSSPEAVDSGSSEDEFQIGSSKPSNSSSKSSSKVDHSKLFSDDEEDEEDEAKNKSKGDDDEEEEDEEEEKSKGNEMEELFGSDYESEEEEFKASGIKESPVQNRRRDNEDEGIDSAEEAVDNDVPGISNEMWIPKTPKASKTSRVFVCKMPNILRARPDEYTEESIEEEMANPSDETLYRNYIRWKYRRDPVTDTILMDPITKLPQRESNTKLVQWEDGTFTLFVGREALKMSRQKISNSFLCANEIASDKPELIDRLNEDDPEIKGQDMVLESHGRIYETVTIRPMTTASKSHKSLSMSMRAKHNKGVQKIKEYISELDGNLEQEQRVKIREDQLRLANRKKARQSYEYDRDRSAQMDANFLEEGYEYEEEESLSAIKQKFGGKKTSSATSRPPRPSGPSRSSAYEGTGGFDEYRRNHDRERDEQQRRRSVGRGGEDEDDQVDQEENEDGDEEEEEEEEDVMVRSTKKRRTVDEDDDDNSDE